MVLGMEGWTQGFLHAKQALYPLSYIPQPSQPDRETQDWK